MGDCLPRQLSVPAPIYPDDPGSRLPRSILLEPRAYLSSRTNGTTAKGSTTDGQAIHVTFWPADPPRVSCFTVHCPDLEPSAFCGTPTIVTTHDDLVLLRFPIGPRSGSKLVQHNHLFVYQAGTKRKLPSLTLIPTFPCSHCIISDRLHALLRCRDRSMFFVAVLLFPSVRNCKEALAEGRYDLHLYSSETGRWSKKPVYVNKSLGNFHYCRPDKVITIGGYRGSVGWVDLWGGMIICHLLLENENTLIYVPVPGQVPPTPMKRWTNALAIRDIIVGEGCIKFFEIHSYTRPGSEWWEWEGVGKKMRFSSIGASNIWEEDGDVRDCEVPVKMPEHAQMLSSFLLHQEGKDAEPTLKLTTPMEFPALSLHDDGVVYILTTLGREAFDKGLVIALDIRNKTLKSVAEFGGHGRPLEVSLKYLQSGISNHMGVWSSSRKHRGAVTPQKGTAATYKDHVQQLCR